MGGNPSNGTDAAVALYVDGVYLSRLTGATFDVADLERVEVLRGPQGTLYGRNSTGRAINFITAKPKGEFYARQGGVFNGSRFEPETLTQYEAGAKAEFLDSRLRVNAVAYRSDYRDLRGQAPNVAGISIFQNIGKAKVTGAELEVTALPLSQLVLNASYGYTSFVYQEYIRGSADVSDITKRPKTPKHIWCWALSGSCRKSAAALSHR